MREAYVRLPYFFDIERIALYFMFLDILFIAYILLILNFVQ